MPDSGSGALANYIAPGNQTAADWAQIGSLGLALAAGRVYVGTTLRYGDSALSQYMPATINGMLDAKAVAPTGALRSMLIPNASPGKSAASWHLDNTQFLQSGSAGVDTALRIYDEMSQGKAK